MARLEIENLSKIFRTSKKSEFYAVQNVTLAVEEGELLVLVGPSGSGKSTLLRMIAGLENASAGTLSIGGAIMNGVPPEERDVAMVFQNHALYPHLTVRENLAFGLKLRKCPKPEIEQRVRETAAMLGLEDCLERLPETLSGGERQRTALGRALVRRPKVFLFDEPLSNLDAPMRIQMRREIAKLHRELGVTTIYVTHDQTEAMALGHRIAVMEGGVIQQIADPLALYNNPANLFVAGFIGSPAMNFIQGTIQQEDNTLHFQGQMLPGLPGASGISARLGPEKSAMLRDYLRRPVVMGVRPEDLIVNPAHRPNASSEPPGEMAATVELAEPLGAEVFLYLATGAQAFVARVGVQIPVRPNQEVWVTINADKAHFFDPQSERVIVQANCPK